MFDFEEGVFVWCVWLGEGFGDDFVEFCVFEFGELVDCCFVVCGCVGDV